jgi:predicted XRE-type DNA-binding protein
MKRQKPAIWMGLSKDDLREFPVDVRRVMGVAIRIPAETSSGNVFADLGFDHPEEELLKAKLAREIRAIISGRRLTQTKSAELLGMKQPDVSAIVTGRAGRFSIDRLVRCLDRLDYKIAQITVNEIRISAPQACFSLSAAERRLPRS